MGYMNDEYTKYLIDCIIEKKTYILLLYKRIYFSKIKYAAKSKLERNEMDISNIETNLKIGKAKDYVKTKETELKYMLSNGQGFIDNNWR
jgi:hypothetical protein